MKTEHNELLNNRVMLDGEEEMVCDNCWETVIFHLKDKNNEFSMGLSTVMECLIFAIQQHIYSSAVWGIRHPQALAQFEGQQIAHQGLIAIIIDKRPFLRLCRGIEHMLLLVELDAIGFLGALS